MASAAAPAPTVSNKQTARIKRDLEPLINNPLSFIPKEKLQLSFVENLNELRGVLTGPENSAYAGGHFDFLIRFLPEYPFKPPEFYFTTPICHPNVHSGTGTACHDQLIATWAPNIPLTELLNKMHSLLDIPNYDTPLADDPLTDKSPKNAQKWTRIQRELRSLMENPLPFIPTEKLKLSVVETLNELTGVLIGPENSAYAGGHFRFLIRFVPEYPSKPPEFYFITCICHPNVHSGTGIACHDQLLATWTPDITLTKLLSEMHSLLATPNYDTPISDDPLAGKSLEKGREWTQQFAQPL